MNILASAFIKVDRQSSQSIAGQITEQIRAKILSGILKKGDSLPSSRLLSQALGCSRNTVIAAYQALSLEGLIETRQGLGTIVASESTMLPHKPEIIDTLKSRQGPLGERKLSNRALVAQSLGKVRTQELIPFALAYPSHQEVPPREWYSEPARLFKSTWAHMSYEFPSDSRSLSMCLCDYVRRTRGIVCEPEQIVITDNFWQGTVLACQLLFEPGDAVILTDPCRYRHRELLEFMNLQPLFVKLDENGLDWQML